MFNDVENDAIGFNSSWRISKSSTDNETQTKDEKGVDKEEQTTSTASKEVQTDDLGGPKTLPKVDEKALAAFLMNICPKVEKELTKMERSQAFASYHLISDKEQQENVTKLYSLPRPKEPSDGPVKVTVLSWSCTGNTLAVACSSSEHSDWCYHSGCICLYNIERAGFNETTLSRVIETTSCVRSISMHPYEPLVIAAGTYSGEVIIWKLQDDDVNNIIVSSDTDSHHEPVTQVEWVRNDTSLQASVLISAALDGQLMVWKGWPRSSNFKLESRYVMGDNESTCEPGISCFSFSPNDPSLCIVAVEGGKLYHCRLDSELPTTRIGVSSALKNPVVNKLETHLGTVTCIAFSPYHHEDTFATTGTDLQIRIYVLREFKPQLIIWCDMDQVGLQWSKTQANILTVWGGGGRVNVYDALTGLKVRDLGPVQQDKTSQLLSAVQFNKKRPQLLAVGDAEGCAHIWKIPTKFSVKQALPDYSDEN